jgi:3-oxoacyl-[acyl-carrier protein] reductase
LLLSNKVGVISGSTRGIGFAIAKEFAEENGATVIICSRNKQSATNAARQIKGKAYAADLDVTSNTSVREFVQNVSVEFGRIDILVNNAGYPFDTNIWYKRFHEITDEELQEIIRVDVQGSVRLSREVISSMLQRDVSKNNGGVIINISSTPAIAGHTHGAPYTIAKAAVTALTKCIAMEYGTDNIRSYTLALGNIATLATYDSMNEDARDKAAEEPSMKRWGKPEEVAKIASCIASDQFSFATGNTIVVDGGTVLL